MRKEQKDFTFFTFARYFSHTKASFASTIQVRAVSEWVDRPVFDQRGLKCVKEAEKKIFPLRRLLPTWFPFIPRKELLGDSAEHTSSLSSDPLTQISDRLLSPDPRQPMAEGS